jgi:hypothetical protein
MPDRFGHRFELPAEDLSRLMNCVVEHAEAGEERDVERVLAVLTTLSAREHEGTVRFTAPRGTAKVVERALRAMARSDRHHERFQRVRQRAS